MNQSIFRTTVLRQLGTLLLNYDAATDGYSFNVDSNLVVRIRGTSFRDTTLLPVRH